jgi:hypothetical protein
MEKIICGLKSKTVISYLLNLELRQEVFLNNPKSRFLSFSKDEDRSAESEHLQIEPTSLTV